MADKISQRERTLRAAFAERLRHALHFTAIAEGGKATQAFLAQLVVGEGGQLSQPAAGDYLRGESIPATFEQMLALARAVSADPGWLFHGPASGALEPSLDVARQRAAERKREAEARALPMPPDSNRPAKKEADDDDVAAAG